MKLHIVREGHGEEDAIVNLVTRTAARNDLDPPHIPRNGNWRKPLVHKNQVEEACRQVAAGDCEALLLTRDADIDDLEDKDCPRTSAPKMASWVADLQLPFPVAVVLFYKEYETLFLAGAAAMAGKGIPNSVGKVVAECPPTLTPHPNPEHPRDAKGWVSREIIKNYKPTLYQTSLTRLLDLEILDQSGLSSYRRLVSALSFLDANAGCAGAVYPAPVWSPQ